MKTDVFRTIESASEGQFKDRGSKFLAYAFPVCSEEQIKSYLKDIRKEHHSARHHCYAYRLGSQNESYRMNDDGEPSGTAGKPIYGQILSYDLTNILLVVVRYFGGTLLGTSGLIMAYRSASDDCLRKAVIVEGILEKEFSIMFEYEQMNNVMRIINDESLSVRKKDFNMDCTMTLVVRQSDYKRVAERFAKVPKLKLQS
jgi:uncharacterized YigZ family protein